MLKGVGIEKIYLLNIINVHLFISKYILFSSFFGTRIFNFFDFSFLKRISLVFTCAQLFAQNQLEIQIANV
jgi:hypothetical protein